MICIERPNAKRPSVANAWHRLIAILLLAIGLSPVLAAAAKAETRTLKLHFIHTGEKAEITYKRNGRYDPAGLAKVNRFLRDWRRNEPTKMNPRLLDLVWQAYKASGSRNYINVVSAYRSPATNSMLRSRSKGVAKKSQHMLGNAMDFYIPGVPLKKLREIGLKMQGGGVGYYPRSGSPFVHFDVGNVRHWPRMSRKELVAVFPNGKTLHVPSDGKPLPGFDQALAAYQSRKKSGGTALALASTGDGKKSKGLLAMLFGGGADEEEESGGVIAADEAPEPKPERRKPVEVAEPEAPEALPGIEPAAPVADRPETIIAALPDRAPIVPGEAPRPKTDVGALATAEMPIPMEDPVTGATGSVPAPAAAAETAIAANVPLPTWRPDDAPAAEAAPVLLALADPNADGNVPLPSTRPSVAKAIEEFSAVPQTRPELGVTEEDTASEDIAALIQATAPRKLAEEEARAKEPVTIVTATGESSKKAARVTRRDAAPRPASVVVPAEPDDARWAFDESYVSQGLGGNTAPSFAYNMVRTAPREVYVNGFQPDGKELASNRFSGKAVAFLPVARFEAN